MYYPYNEHLLFKHKIISGLFSESDVVRCLSVLVWEIELESIESIET